MCIHVSERGRWINWNTGVYNHGIYFIAVYCSCHIMVCNLVTYVYHNARFKKRKVYYITCMFVKLYNWKYVVTEGHKYLSREPHVGQYWSKQ